MCLRGAPSTSRVALWRVSRVQPPGPNQSRLPLLPAGQLQLFPPLAIISRFPAGATAPLLHLLLLLVLADVRDLRGPDAAIAARDVGLLAAN